MIAKLKPVSLRASSFTLTLAVSIPFSSFWAVGQTATGGQAAASRARAVGTVKSVNGDTVTLTTDGGSEISVVVQPSTRLVRTLPGQTDLKSARPVQLSDVQVGDRLLVGGTASEDGKGIVATTAIVMKKNDIAEKQAREREDWQKRGVGGVVKAVDPTGGIITISTGGLDPTATLAVQVSKSTTLLRYAPNSVNFDDAKPGDIGQIKPADQLRARGTRSANGKELAADEVVSGTFRNIAGTVVTKNEGQNTLTVQDLATKKPVTLTITSQSQLRKMPAMMAQRIAARLKGGAGSPAGAPPATRVSDTSTASNPVGSRPGGGTPDFQQMLSRMPAITLADLQKGDALMIVATEGGAESGSMAIVLLTGVEPILTASPKDAQTVLSPWNLSLAGGGGTGDTP
jgi:hypothetical protein